jgi:hypothetical protein
MGFSPYGPLRKTRTQQAATVRERVTREFARIDPAPKSDIWNMQSEIHYSPLVNQNNHNKLPAFSTATY